MRELLKFLLCIIYVPLYWFISTISRVRNRKYSAIRIQISYVSREAFITSQCDSEEQKPAHFIVAYLLFLSQYFYACDERQITLVAKCLVEHIENCGRPDQLADLLLGTVRITFNQQENDAFVGLFRYPNLLPTTYVEGTTSKPKKAKYTIMIYKRPKSNRWSIDLHVSWWMNTILFPITVGILYHYVSDKIGSENKAVLDSCIMQLLAAQDSSDYRSLNEGAVSLIPNLIIAKNVGV